MINFEEQVKLAKSLNIWSSNINQLKIVDLNTFGLNAIYVYEPTRGGKQIIIGEDGKMLGFTSALTLEKVVNDIKTNNLWEKAKKLIKTKYPTQLVGYFFV